MTAANEKPDCPCCRSAQITLHIHHVSPVQREEHGHCNMCGCNWPEHKRRAQPAEAVDEAKEREAFEKWWDNCSLPKVDEGYYGQLEDCWLAWLARANLEKAGA